MANEMACPLRKRRIAAAYAVNSQVCEWEDEFLPCIGEACGLFSEGNGTCAFRSIAESLIEFEADGLNVKAVTAVQKGYGRW